LPVGLVYHHLDDADVRAAMVHHWRAEMASLSQSLARDAWPFGRTLSDAGWAVYLEVMPVALLEHDDAWLWRCLLDQQLWIERVHYERLGQSASARVNIPASAATLAVGEFNTAYVRGLAAVLLDHGVETCTVHRAGGAVEPRSECALLEGQAVRVQTIIDGHRASYFPPPGRDGVPAPVGPGCHHSIRM